MASGDLNAWVINTLRTFKAGYKVDMPQFSPIGPVAEVIHSPAHPYTLGLMGSIPTMDEDRVRLLQIDGAMPRLNAIPPGCAFNPRCPRAFAPCFVDRPELMAAGSTRAACWLHAPPLRAAA